MASGATSEPHAGLLYATLRLHAGWLHATLCSSDELPLLSVCGVVFVCAIWAKNQRCGDVGWIRFWFTKLPLSLTKHVMLAVPMLDVMHVHCVGSLHFLLLKPLASYWHSSFLVALGQITGTYNCTDNTLKAALHYTSCVASLLPCILAIQK